MHYVQEPGSGLIIDTRLTHLVPPSDPNKRAYWPPETICGLDADNLDFLLDDAVKLAKNLCPSCAMEGLMFLRKPSRALHAGLHSNFQLHPEETFCGRNTEGMVKVAGGSGYIRSKCGRCQKAAEVWYDAQ